MSVNLFDGFTLLKSTKRNKSKRMRLGTCTHEHTQYMVHMEDFNSMQEEFVLYIGSSETEANRVFNQINMAYFESGN